MKLKDISKLSNRGFIHNILLFFLLVFYADLSFPEGPWISIFNIGLSTFIFALCLYKINKWLFRAFLISVSLVTGIYYPILEFFGPISPSSIEAVMATNNNETSSYLTIIPKLLYLKAFLIILIGILLSFLNYRFVKTKFSIIILVLFLGSAFSKRFLFSRENYYGPTEGAFNIIPAKVLEKLPHFYKTALKGLNYQNQLLTEKDNWQIESSNPDKELYIIIIGESVRYDVFSDPKFMQPHPLDTIPKINFEHAISYANNTISSIRSAMVLKNKSDPTEYFFPNNIVNLAKKAGLHTEWLSNQFTVGTYENYTTALARCADYSQFLNNTMLKETYDRGEPDSLLGPLLKERLLQDKNKNSLYFLHTFGSHPSACITTNGAYDKFVLSDEISCYIKTVSNLKKLIYEVYQIAKEDGKTFKIMYFSDHGLAYDPENKVLKHVYSKQSYTIPLFILADDLTKNINIDAPRNLGDFLNLFQEFTGIQAKGMFYDYRFTSEDEQKNFDQLSDGQNFNQVKNSPIPYP